MSDEYGRWWPVFFFFFFFFFFLVGGGQERWIRKVGWVQKHGTQEGEQERERRRRALAGGREARSVEPGGDGWLVRERVVARVMWLSGGQRIRPARRRVAAQEDSGDRVDMPRVAAVAFACHERSAASNDACRRRAVAA